MIRMHSFTVLALCLLTAACAADPENTQSNGVTGDSPVDIVEQYYAKEGVPEGWRIERIGGSETVLVTVTPSKEQWARILSQSTSAAEPFHQQFCPQWSDAAWESIADNEEISVSIVVNVPDAPTKVAVPCERHGTS